MKAIDRITQAIETGDGVYFRIEGEESDTEITALKIAADPDTGRAAYYVVHTHTFPANVTHHTTLEGAIEAMRVIAPLNRWKVIKLWSQYRTLMGRGSL